MPEREAEDVRPDVHDVDAAGAGSLHAIRDVVLTTLRVLDLGCGHRIPLRIRSSLVLVAGNWKMFKGQAETVAFLGSFEPPGGVDIVVCPPFTSLAAAVG